MPALEKQEYETIARIKEQLLRSITLSENAKLADNRAQLTAVRSLYNKIMLEIVGIRRNGLYKIREEKHYDSSIIKELEYTLDLEESRLKRK